MDRLSICKKCPICDTNKWICNSKLYLNPETNDVSVKPKTGYIKGCGCLLQVKTKNPNAKCPTGKW